MSINRTHSLYTELPLEDTNSIFHHTNSVIRGFHPCNVLTRENQSTQRMVQPRSVRLPRCPFYLGQVERVEESHRLEDGSKHRNA